MAENTLLEVLQQREISTRRDYSASAFERNIGLLSDLDQERLGRARVAIPGLGGVGGLHLLTLTRTGLGSFHLADFDSFEPANFNRQVGATVATLGKSKLDVMMAEALSINPFLDIKPFSQGVTKDNIAEFLDGVDVVVDGLDFFQFDIRRLLFNTARTKGIPVITAAPLGYSTALLVFTPTGMSFDEYFDVSDDLPMQAKLMRFLIGLAPQTTHAAYVDWNRVDLGSKKGPSLGLACQLCAAAASTEVVRLLLGKPGLKPVPHYLQYDPFTRTLRQGRLRSGNRALRQRLKIRILSSMLAAAERARPVVPELPPPVEEVSGVTVEALDYLLRAAIQAPSGDNAQPWRFSVSSTTNEASIAVYIDRDADQSFFNVRQTASVVACGAALENIRIAARGLGLDPKVDTTPDPSERDLMGVVRLSLGGKGREPLFDRLFTRCTNRRPFSRESLPSWLPEELGKEIQGFDGCKVHLLTDRASIEKAASVVFLADRIRTEHRGLHEYFSSMVRFSKEAAESTRDGLPLKNLEGGLPGEVFLRVTKPWPVMSLFNTLGLGRIVASHAKQGILDSGAVGMVTVDGFEERHFLEGARALERVWLALTHHGLEVQPMTAITLFWLRWLWEGPEAFMPKHGKLLASVFESLHTLFSEIDFQTTAPVMLFRVGYGPKIRCRTLRKDIESFRLSKQAMFTAPASNTVDSTAA